MPLPKVLVDLFSSCHFQEGMYCVYCDVCGLNYSRSELNYIQTKCMTCGSILTISHTLF